MSFVNQSNLGVDGRYPERLAIPDEETDWNRYVADYHPSQFPDFPLTQERLAEAGLVVADEGELVELGMLSNQEIEKFYGKVAVDLRHPLGRTGISGTGIFYNAGDSATANMFLMRRSAEGEPQVLLVHTRNKWTSPGGFCEDKEKDDRKVTAIRELQEEAKIDSPAANAYIEDALHNETGIISLTEVEIKPNSPRSVDYAWISNQAFALLLPESGMAEVVSPGSDDPKENIEAVKWFSLEEVWNIPKNQMSSDQRRYFDLAYLALVSDSEEAS